MQLARDLLESEPLPGAEEHVEPRAGPPVPVRVHPESRRGAAPLSPVDPPDDGAPHSQEPPRSAQAVDATAQSWLDAQCDVVAGLARGVVFLRTSDDPRVRPIARWPRARGDVPLALVDAARGALEGGGTVIRTHGDDGESGEGTCIVAAPLLVQGGEASVVALELPGAMRSQQQAIVQLLQWGATWYRLLRQERRATRPEDRLATVVEMLASSLEHDGFEAAAINAVTELATRLSCTRVSLGLLRGKHVEVRAISSSARVDTRSNLVRAIAGAMDEAVDQDATVGFPALPGTLPYVAFAQEVLAGRGDGACVCSTPLHSGTRTVGALTLEREGERGFDPAAIEICETLGALLGPVVDLKYDSDRWIGVKVWRSLLGLSGRLLGRGHVTLKLYGLALAAILGFVCVATGDYRITAEAKVEGSVKRVVTAPQDGYVASAELRAGDSVEAGQVLATLDDRELRLEQLKWRSQREQLDTEHRAAATGHDRSRAAVLRAQMKQSDAQLALIDGQLARTRLTAPFSGVVVSGDLSQNLGSPVEHGQVLFEVAPLDAYRVILEVDERDVGDIIDTQRGELTLTGLPDAALAFTVTRVVPVSTPRDGRNFFEVEATLDVAPTSLRPGMAGIGKIQVDRRKLAWIWTHTLVDWLRLSLWTWT